MSFYLGLVEERRAYGDDSGIGGYSLTQLEICGGQDLLAGDAPPTLSWNNFPRQYPRPEVSS